MVKGIEDFERLSVSSISQVEPDSVLERLFELMEPDRNYIELALDTLLEPMGSPARQNDANDVSNQTSDPEDVGDQVLTIFTRYLSQGLNGESVVKQPLLNRKQLSSSLTMILRYQGMSESESSEYVDQFIERIQDLTSYQEFVFDKDQMIKDVLSSCDKVIKDVRGSSESQGEEKDA